MANRIRNFEVKKDDAWVLTYPKCGTTWTEEIVWLLRNDLNFEKALKIRQADRSIFIEEGLFMGEGMALMPVEQAENLPSPRQIKSHLPIALLPKELMEVKPKIIYVVRDPRDVVVSYYHHYRIIAGFTGPLDEFVDAFVEDSLCYSPYWETILEFWDLRHEDHILFLTYEDMKKNLRSVIDKLCDFFGKSYSDEQIAALEDHVSFNSMKNNPQVNKQDIIDLRAKHIGFEPPKDVKFIRQGQAGGWKNELSEESRRKIEQWSRNALKNTDYPPLEDMLDE
ncbi:sulfotransferase 1C4-like [Ctenocephalides felis]|uniref:sulfotransferase 1C4-like n=1 Tax=Ctenocephalides felis TaxID=7515 RepID=UPI000E6E3573|nr:sulfotransferase 1C4-like [Ctenocephalides felis]